MTPGSLLQPDHFDAFHCIGSDCEDTCCVGWIVHVDKSTYDKYQNCADPELGPRLHTLIEIKQQADGNHSGNDSGNDDEYARIALDGVVCPFFSSGLCSIQQRLGEEYLSKRCATYPRVINRVGELLQRSLDLSCPEAARVVLLNPSPIAFDKRDYVAGAVGSIRVGVPSLDTSAIGDGREPYEFFGVVQGLVISLLQNRSYPIWKRLAMVGSLCEKLDEVGAQDSGRNAVNVIQEHADSLGNGLLDDVLCKSPANLSAQLEGALDLIAAGISPDFNPPRFLECYREFISGIQWTPQSTIEEIGIRFAEARVQYYAGFMSRHEYIMEHYLVNYAFKTLFPFGLPASNRRLRHDRVRSPVVPQYVAQYMMMIVHYAVTRAVLIGMAGFHKSAFGVDHVVRAIQSCTKALEHSVSYPGLAIGILAEKAMTTPASLCVLIQD
jgi:lysine-N-methylase